MYASVNRDEYADPPTPPDPIPRPGDGRSPDPLTENTPTATALTRFFT